MVPPRGSQEDVVEAEAAQRRAQEQVQRRAARIAATIVGAIEIALGTADARLAAMYWYCRFIVRSGSMATVLAMSSFLPVLRFSNSCTKSLV